MTHDRRIGSMLSTGQVADLVGVSAGTVRRWHNRGVIKAYRISPRGGRMLRIVDVARLMHDRAETSVRAARCNPDNQSGFSQVSLHS